MKTIDQVKKIVKSECYKPTSKYGSEPFNSHIIPMVKYAKKLAIKLDADVEIVELAAWLHDVGSIIYGRKDHHNTGAAEAEKILSKLKYPKEKIALIKKCIRHHRSSRNDKRKSLEEKIVAEADALSHFDNIQGVFWAAFLFEKKNQAQGKKEVIEKTKRKWQQLEFPEARKMVTKKYKAIMLIFDN